MGEPWSASSREPDWEWSEFGPAPRIGHVVAPIAPDVDGEVAALKGRDGHGRFAKGNRISRGNPLARRVARLRAALVRAVTPEDIAAVVEALIEKARSGDVAAARELLDRTLGKPDALDFNSEQHITPGEVGELMGAFFGVARRRFGEEEAEGFTAEVLAALKELRP